MRERPPSLLPLWLFALLPLVAAAPGARAVTLEFAAVDLVDGVPGEDAWQYAYWLSDFDFAPDEGFSVLFDPALYASLASPPPVVNADWSAATLQPDTGLPSDGRYEAIAQVASPSLADPFVVSFVWLGEGAPGVQEFLVFDSSLFPVDGGTSVPVPEPATALLLLAGLAALGSRAGRR